MECPVNEWVENKKLENPKFKTEDFLKDTGMSRQLLNWHKHRPAEVWTNDFMILKISVVTGIPVERLNPQKNRDDMLAELKNIANNYREG